MSEIIFAESNGSLSFGNYKSAEKLKSNDFEVNGDVYKIKTHKEITRVEKNNKLLFESVPGSLIRKFALNERECSFFIEGSHNSQITLELEPEKEYGIYIDNASAGTTRASGSGKLTFSLELNEISKNVKIERI